MSENLVKNNVGSPKESHKAPKPVDLNDIEMVFGSPTSPKRSPLPDVHIANEKKNGKDTHSLNNNNNNKIGEVDPETTPSMQPLLEPDKEPNKPPLAGPEIDDLDDEHPTSDIPYPGIDDGLLEPNGKTPGHDEGEEKNGENDSHDTPATREDGVGTEDGKWPWTSTDETDYPGYDGFSGIGPRFGVDDRPGSPMIPGTVIPDVNTYQQKKNLAQGMMDLALLSANANQLRYVLESSNAHPYYYPSLTFISFSIILQVAVGVGLIMNSRYNVKDEKDICKADKINNMTVLGIFLVTIVNVFITSFSVATPTGPSPGLGGQVIQQAG